MTRPVYLSHQPATAQKEQTDAILMDVMMPEMDGPTTFRHLQADATTRHIPVVLLTAKVRGVDQRRFAGLGVAAVFFKPFDPLNLAAQISEALGWTADRSLAYVEFPFLR